MEPNPVIIPFSKSKTLLWLTGAIAFVVIGCWLLLSNPAFHNALLNNPLITKTTGTASLLFFGIATYFLVRNLMTKGPGLIIDEMGIEDFSSAISGPKTYWNDIEAIEAIAIQSQPVLLIKVKNPQTYIDQATGFKRKMMQLNYKGYGTPISISANGLQISFEELRQLVTGKYEAYINSNDRIK